MDYELIGDPKGFPVFVVFDEIRILGVFMTREKADDCALKNLALQRQISIQLCYINDIKTITYEIIK